MRRHDLATLTPDGWIRALAARRDLADQSLVATWADRGWPLVACRRLPSEVSGVPLGLPLPPSAGKQRLRFVLTDADIAATSRPPTLASLHQVAPRNWRPTLDQIEDLAEHHAVTLRVFGSLAWFAITGLDFLTRSSDLDLLIDVRSGSDIPSLVDDLARIEANAPMRLDGELIREDGAAANWRELFRRDDEIIVKTAFGVCLLAAPAFCTGSVLL